MIDFSALRATVRDRLESLVSSMEKQAPGARMIGKFAVQQAVTEANKKITDLSNNSEDSTQPKE